MDKTDRMMTILRWSKTLLVASVAFFFTLVVVNNLTDYDSNYQLVHHVLSMDTTFLGNRAMWRAIYSVRIHALFYNSIILWEAISAVLMWAGTAQLLRAVRKSPTVFQRAKAIAIIGLTVSLLMWFIAFLSVGGEWFLMWQSQKWNGQEAAAHMFLVTGVIFLLLLTPEHEQ